MTNQFTYQASLARIDDLLRQAAQQRQGNEVAGTHRTAHFSRLGRLQITLGRRQPERVA